MLNLMRLKRERVNVISGCVGMQQQMTWRTVMPTTWDGWWKECGRGEEEKEEVRELKLKMG